jgi:hypothetical protein
MGLLTTYEPSRERRFHVSAPDLTNWAAPLAIGVGSGLALAHPATGPTARQLVLGEQHAVEVITALSLLAAGFIGLRAGCLLRGRKNLHCVALGLFGLLMLLVAMEEIAWGQHILHFETPAAFAANRQGELTLHNMPGMHGHTEYLRAAFGLAGLMGLAMRRHRWLRDIAPSPGLLPWFLTITLLAVPDLLLDFDGGAQIAEQLHWKLNRTVQQLSEVVEMLIGLTALGYVWLLKRRLRGVAPH